MGDDVLQFYEKIVPSLRPHCSIIEVGVWTGRSLVHLAKLVQYWELAATVYGVDTFDGGKDATPEMRDYVNLHGGSLYNLCLENLKKSDVDDFVKLVRVPSPKAAERFADGASSLVFIDASHRYADVRADIQAWLPKVRSGYVLAGHDFGTAPGVERAVRELLPDFRRSVGNCWYMRI